MGEEHPDGDLVLVAAAERGDVIHDRVIEPDLLFIVQDHDRRSGSDDFAKRCYVVDRAFGVDRSAAAAPRQLSKALLVYRRTISAYNH